MPRDLVIAIIASASALSGVVISAAINLLISIFDKRHKRQVLLREKLEQLMDHLSESLTWMVELNNCISIDQVLTLPQCMPARKALSLAILYFPELVSSANNYILAQNAYFSSVATSFRPDIPHNAGAQALVHNPNHQKVSGQLISAKNEFERLVAAVAPKYIKA